MGLFNRDRLMIEWDSPVPDGKGKCAEEALHPFRPERNRGMYMDMITYS